ncbi:MAG: carboxypeptidase-like regulatory domain-containing protein, partial [Bryobacteraceae bacterium]
NIEGLTISLSPAAPITGTVTAQEGDLQTLLKSKTPRITLRLLPSEGLSGRPTLVQVKDDGVFRFPTAGVAKYWWSVSGVPEEVYVKSASFGEKDVTRAQLDDSTGEGGILRIVLSSQAASLSGAAPRGMTVRVWPRIPDLGDSAGGMRSVTADQDGGFRFAGLAPGEYYVAATDDIEQGLAESPEFLARFNGDALLVRLDKGEHAAVDVKLISAEKVATEIARLP